MRNPALTRLNMDLADYREAVRGALAPHRLELIRAREAWVRRTEAWVGQHLVPGDEVDVEHISPRLQLVTTKQQHEIWRYCRFWGSIPYNRGCGRLLRYLLRDDGQPGAPVMGIIALSSPVLISKPRDEWIGWEYPRDLEIKRRRLLACMDLSVLMAVPPYTHLTAGKMICLAVLADEVRQDYRDKFQAVATPTGLTEGRLALIATTSLYGSSVQYNRLAIDGRLAYRIVGYTSGYGNSHLTETEFADMERYLEQIGRRVPKGWGNGRSYRLRVYTTYARLARGEKHAPPHEQERSVYVAPLAENTQAFLRGVTDELQPYGMPFSHLVQTWTERWLARRLANEAVMERFRAANPTGQLLSRQIAATAAQAEGHQAV